LQVTPTPEDKAIQIGGNDLKLSQKQQYDLQKQIGQATQDKWSQIIASPSYQSKNDIDKADQLNSARKNIAGNLREQFAKNNNLSPGKTLSSSKSSSSGLGKDASYADKLSAAQDDFNTNSGDWSAVEKLKKQRDINYLKVQKDYDKDTVSLYNMKKDDVYNLVTTDPSGKDLLNKLLNYGDSLVNAGLTDTNKYRDKYGNISVATKKKGGAGSRGGRTGSYSLSSFSKVNNKVKSAKVKNIKLAKSSKPRGMAAYKKYSTNVVKPKKQLIRSTA
jgi:hypothetical protein